MAGLDPAGQWPGWKTKGMRPCSVTYSNITVQVNYNSLEQWNAKNGIIYTETKGANLVAETMLKTMVMAYARGDASGGWPKDGWDGGRWLGSPVTTSVLSSSSPCRGASLCFPSLFASVCFSRCCCLLGGQCFAAVFFIYIEVQVPVFSSMVSRPVGGRWWAEEGWRWCG